MNLAASQKILDADILQRMTVLCAGTFQNGIAAFHDLHFQMELTTVLVNAANIFLARARHGDQRHLDIIFFYDRRHMFRITQNFFSVNDLTDTGIIDKADDMSVNAFILNNFTA